MGGKALAEPPDKHQPDLTGELRGSLGRGMRDGGTLWMNVDGETVAVGGGVREGLSGG